MIKGSDRRIALGVAALAAALAFAGARVGLFSGGAPAGNLRDDPAPELVGISTWINTEPLTIGGLRGTVVLIDFWTYSCINCVRTFPFLRAMYERYRSHGFQILGVHSPEFAFEKDPDNVRAEVGRNRIRWPVAMDNDMRTWDAYRNRFWPRVYLIDRNGRIRFDHAGEGGEDLIESRVRQALARPGATLPAPLNFTGRDFPPDLTPEIYLGHARGLPAGALANPEGYRPGRRLRYPAQPVRRVRAAGTSGQFFLAGDWTAEEEFVRAEAPGARIDVQFRARDVFVVAGPGVGDRAVEVLLDGRALAAEGRGGDVRDGVLRLERMGLYSLVRLDAVETHVLTLRPRGEGARFFTFTFG